METTREFSWRAASLRALIVSVVLAAVLGMIAVLAGEFGDLQGRVLMTTLTVGVTSVLGLACGSYLDREPGNPIGRAGIGLSLLAAAMVLPIIWDFHAPEIYVKALFSVVIFAVAAAHLCLLWLAELAPGHRWAQRGALTSIVAAIVLLLVVLWAELEEESLWRALGVIAIADAAFTLMVPIFHRMSINVVGGGDRLARIEAELSRLRERMGQLESERARLTSAS